MNIKGVRANLLSQGMKVLFGPLRVQKSYRVTEALFTLPVKAKSFCEQYIWSFGHYHGSHLDWKTWENGKPFSSQGIVREFSTDWKSQEKSHKILENSGNLR